MPLIMPDEQFPAKPVIVMIVGTPGSYKSSLSMTAKNAIHIDGDGGGQRAVRKCPVLSVKSWSEIRLEDENGVFNGKETCIFDTPKSLLDDYLWEWCQQQKYQADDRKVYGAIATELKAFSAKRRLEGMDQIFVAHEKSAERKDKVIYEPDITGQTKQILLRMCDQIGFMEKREVRGADGKNTIQTVLTFNARPEWPFCKNTAQIEDIIIPHFSTPGWNTFMQDKVIQPLKDYMAARSEEQRVALDFIETWHGIIDTADLNDANLKALSTDISQIAEEHLKKQVRAYLSAHLKKVEWKWDAPNKVFVPVNPPAPPVDDKSVVTAEDMVKEAEAQKAALNEPPTEDLFAEQK